MCRPATCKTCRKATWSGCGEHVDQVMRTVPKKDQCVCADTAASSTGGGMLSRMFNR
ncbi:MAG: hypothetical protein ACI867_001270 [Glaciecola sp.]|jgi:hypothetical protein